jgi:hypothetical protein
LTRHSHDWSRNEIIKAKKRDREKLVITARDREHRFKLAAFHVDPRLPKGEAVTVEYCRSDWNIPISALSLLWIGPQENHGPVDGLNSPGAGPRLQAVTKKRGVALHARLREEFASPLSEVETIQTFPVRASPYSAGFYSARLPRVPCYSRPSGLHSSGQAVSPASGLFQTSGSIHRSTDLKSGITRCTMQKTLLKLLPGTAQARHHRS